MSSILCALMILAFTAKFCVFSQHRDCLSIALRRDDCHDFSVLFQILAKYIAPQNLGPPPKVHRRLLAILLVSKIIVLAFRRSVIFYPYTHYTHTHTHTHTHTRALVLSKHGDRWHFDGKMVFCLRHVWPLSDDPTRNLSSDFHERKLIIACYAKHVT